MAVADAHEAQAKINYVIGTKPFTRIILLKLEIYN